MCDTLVRCESENSTSDQLGGNRLTPVEVLDLYRFTPYLVPILPPGRMLKGGKVSKGKEPNWPVIKTQRGTSSQNAYREKPPSVDAVLEWLKLDPETNIGVLTGEAPGKAVLDFDGPLPSCWDLLDLPNTQMSATGRIEGGCHVYFGIAGPARTTAEVKLPCNGTKLKLIAETGHVVAPGSLHESMKRYAWLPGRAPGDVELPLLPEGLQEVFRDAGDKNTPLTSTPGKSPRQQSGHVFMRTNSDKVNIHLVRDKSWVLDSELVVTLNQSLEAGARMLNEMGYAAREQGSFSCIRHQHDETPSAVLFQAYDGNVLYKCFHHDAKAVTIGQVYAECMNGILYDAPRDASTRWSDKRMDAGEAKAWTVRAYHDLLGNQLPDLEVEPLELKFTTGQLRADAQTNVEKVYRGFILLLRVREAYEPGNLPAPYSYRFAARWCGMKKETAGAAVKWLFAHGYLTSDSRTSSGLNLISLKGVRESTNAVPEVKIDDSEARVIASAVTSLGHAITEFTDRCSILAEELGLDETVLMKNHDAVAGSQL